MANSEHNYNIYVNLAQSAYTGRENNFPYEELDFDKKKEMNLENSIKYKFPDAKDAYGNDISTIYLQADNTLSHRQSQLLKQCIKKLLK